MRGKVGEIATTHPVLRDAGDWQSVRFFRHRCGQLGDDDKVLIAIEDGTPLLIERTIGAGHMLVLTAPVEREWNDLAIHPLFVHFIAEAARYLVRGGASAASTTVGSVVATGLTAAGGGQIFDPRGGRVLAWRRRTAADSLIPDQAGFYEIRGNDGARWLAVNVDARESDLAPLPADYVARWQAMRRARAAPQRRRSRADDRRCEAAFARSCSCSGSRQRCCSLKCCWRIATSPSAGRCRNEPRRATRKLSATQLRRRLRTHIYARAAAAAVGALLITVFAVWLFNARDSRRRSRFPARVALVVLLAVVAVVAAVACRCVDSRATTAHKFSSSACPKSTGASKRISTANVAKRRGKPHR